MVNALQFSQIYKRSKLSLLIWTKGTAYQHHDWSGYVNTILLQWNVECFAIFTNFGKINLEQSWLIQPRVLFASWLLNTMRQHLIVAKSKAQSDDKCFTVFKIEENFIWQQIFSANFSTTSHSFETEKELQSFSRHCLIFQSNQLWFFLFLLPNVFTLSTSLWESRSILTTMKRVEMCLRISQNQIGQRLSVQVWIK